MPRTTRQKELILNEVRNSSNHPTADEVYHAVRQRLPRISLGTVYRNLNMMSRDGLIRTLEGPGSRRFDGEMGEHCHVRCVSCGKVRDFEQELVPVLELPKTASNGFMITDFQIEFSGLCEKCGEVGIRGGKKHHG